MSYNAGTPDNGNAASWSAVGIQLFARSYTYDSLNRVQSMSDSASNQGCQGMTWTVDAWGNMTNETGTKGTCYNFSSSVNTNNQLQSGYQYDAAGNMIYDGSHSYTYDNENRLIQVDGGSTASYTYNETGERVEKKTGSGFTEYIYGANNLVHTEWNGSASWPAQYVYAGNNLVALYTNSTTEFVHSDHLGSTRSVTAVNQSIVDNMDYLPYGLVQSGGSAITHKFTGKEHDSESGNDYFAARYYASALSRFMTPDWAAKPTSVPYAKFGDPQTLNLYTYVENAPLNRIDADGHAQSQTGDYQSGCGTNANSCQQANTQSQTAQNTSLTGEIVNTLTTEEGFKKALTEFEKSPAAMVVAPEGDVAEGAAKIISTIGKDAKLVKYAEEAGQSVQKGLDHLVEQLGKGNTNPGLGTKGLGEGISYARARDGARVFFRKSGEQIEIMAKASKANEAKVINYLKSLY